MQAFKTRTSIQSITSTQSLAAVQTLLRAGLGCITFLRNLLPDDNFSESHFTTSDESLPYDSADTSFSSSVGDSERRKVNGFKIMTIDRGHTDEADKVLNYLENGIFDALRRQYLRSFMFAVYLDSKDPNNIVEAYTFNFQYQTIPGTSTVVPIMSLGDNLKSNSTNHDPVSEAAKKGKPPTLKDVKKSVKTLLKTLIHAMSQMDVLPSRRFVTFKVYYTDDTPSDYEPPHFQSGDMEKDKWYFMTHDLDEIPDKWSIGRVNTGHHSVNLSVTSIATYLPSSTEHDNATFMGTTTRTEAHPHPTPVEEARGRAQQAERQEKDAENRNIAWSAEDDIELGDEDAEGEEDPDYEQLPDGRYEPINGPEKNVTPIPIGVRNQDGSIEPILLEANSEAHFCGVSESVPTRLKEMNKRLDIHDNNIEQTQSMLNDSQDSDPLEKISSDTLLPSISPEPCISAIPYNTPPSPMHGINDYLNGMSLMDNSAGNDNVPMLDLETQVVDTGDAEDSIQSTSIDFFKEDIDSVSTSTPTSRNIEESDIADSVLECDCGVKFEDASCFCEGGCRRWYHVWCMGYHSTKDQRMPTNFICFDCRLHADFTWELIKIDLYPSMISKFRNLALFRRAIKVAETKRSGTSAEIAKHFGNDNNLVRPLIKRLEEEGFITEQANANDTGMFEAQLRNNKSKGKRTKQRRNAQKPRYVFNTSIKKTSKYEDYFNPDPVVENRLLGLAELKKNLNPRKMVEQGPISDHGVDDISFRHRSNPVSDYNDTQTQPETQINKPKRRSPDFDELSGIERPKKKVKISITAGLDLAE